MWHGVEMEDYPVVKGVMLKMASPAVLFDHHWESVGR